MQPSVVVVSNFILALHDLSGIDYIKCAFNTQHPHFYASSMTQGGRGNFARLPLEKYKTNKQFIDSIQEERVKNRPLSKI